MIDHEAWLGLTTEDIVEPDLPICDSHHHLWNSPERRYLLEELFRDIGGGNNIVSTVFVESESAKNQGTVQRFQPVAETRFTHDITTPEKSKSFGNTKVAAGIVGFADFRLGAEVAPVIDAHLAASDRFRGFRQISAWDPNSDSIRSASAPGLLLDKKFREGISCLKNYNLTFETFLYHPQIMDFVDVAGAFPDITMILDHVGSPIGIGPYASRRNEVIQEWKSAMAELAACPNVYIKIGGAGMSVLGFGWDRRAAPPNSIELAEAMSPYYLYCIEKFGAERCMFESNFPVDRASYSYTVLWNAFKRMSKDFSREERSALFYSTALKAYRL